MDLWWNARTRTCITVATVNGRYDIVTKSPAPECGPSASEPTALPQPLLGESRPMSGQPVRLREPWFDLGLVCFGEGQRPTLATRYGYNWDYDRGRYTYGDRTELATLDFDASVMIQLWDGGTHPPADKLDPAHSFARRPRLVGLDSVSRGRDRIGASTGLTG